MIVAVISYCHLTTTAAAWKSCDKDYFPSWFPSFITSVKMRNRKSKEAKCYSLGRVSAKLLLSWLTASTIPTIATASWAESWLHRVDQAPFTPVQSPSPYESYVPESPPRNQHQFTLRHIFDHGMYKYQGQHRRLDIGSNCPIWVFSRDGEERSELGILRVRSTTAKIERLEDRRIPTIQAFYETARLTGKPPVLDDTAWRLDEVPAPDITDKETVLSMARMSWDAYTAEPGTGEWQDATGGFNHSQGFGWEGDTLRGHIFADQDNSTIVISIKGTSPGELTLTRVINFTSSSRTLRGHLNVLHA